VKEELKGASQGLEWTYIRSSDDWNKRREPEKRQGQDAAGLILSLRARLLISATDTAWRVKMAL